MIPFMMLDVRTPEEYAAGHISGAKLIPVQQLAEHLDGVPHDKQVYVQLIDVRSPEEYQASHAPGTKLMPLNTLMAQGAGRCVSDLPLRRSFSPGGRLSGVPVRSQ